MAAGRRHTVRAVFDPYARQRARKKMVVCDKSGERPASATCAHRPSEGEVAGDAPPPAARVSGEKYRQRSGRINCDPGKPITTL